MSFVSPFLPGDKITVFDENRIELGEGTLIRVEALADIKMVAYECREHIILAKSTHYVRRADDFIKVELDARV